MRQSISSRRFHQALFTTALSAFGLLFSGCQKPEPPPVAYIGPTLASSDLGVEQPISEKTGFIVLEEESSQGRFPGALAIARLAAPQGFLTPDNNNLSQKHWSIGTIKWEEAMGWNYLGNQIPDLREIIVLDQYTTVGSNGNLKLIVDAARRLDASLCLVYGPSPAEPAYAGLWGVILDTKTSAKVAFVQAQAGPIDYEPPHADRREEDMRHRDPNYLVVRKFQHEVRNCILANLARDQKLTTTQPSPWQTEEPRPNPVYVVPLQ